MKLAKFIKFHGNNKYFAGLAQTDNDKYVLIHGLIGKIDIKIIHDETARYDEFPIIQEQTAQVEIPFIENDDHHLFTLIGLHNKEEYDTILSLLEVIYGE